MDRSDHPSWRTSRVKHANSEIACVGASDISDGTKTKMQKKFFDLSTTIYHHHRRCNRDDQHHHRRCNRDDHGDHITDDSSSLIRHQFVGDIFAISKPRFQSAATPDRRSGYTLIRDGFGGIHRKPGKPGFPGSGFWDPRGTRGDRGWYIFEGI